MANYKKGEGVPDLVLLEDLSEKGLLDNLLVRYKVDAIYTYIGDVVISVNPFKRVDIYKASDIAEYKGRYKFERPPHLYALANDAYRALLQTRLNQCIIISGESGAGKTEASKIIMQFIAAVSPKGDATNKVKDQLLDSNPILEAFGNAKTLRNDNSSRFGKYMELQFNFIGAPIGGKISNYLLEKGRVVNRAVGERSFHIFYQMLGGCSEAELSELKLKRDPNAYPYLASSQCIKVDTLHDQNDYQLVVKSMKTLGIPDSERKDMFRVLAAILHLGSVAFKEEGGMGASQPTCSITNPDLVQAISDLLGCQAARLKKALTFRTISTGLQKRASQIAVPLDHGQALLSRDALAKALYDRLFSYLVQLINSKIYSNAAEKDRLVIGVLDIYGFEIFEKNSFEQLCINLCNEKLQQLFIELTLKSEQEEYHREGIQWETIEYFNNKIICDLIEKKPVGILAFLDEACLLAKATDLTWLDAMNKNFMTHNHFESLEKVKKIKGAQGFPNDAFTIKHYAGDVRYYTPGFIEKNKDTLFLDLTEAMQTSSMMLLKALFPIKNTESKKLPESAGSQFKTAMNELISTLLKCSPHYVRCIKPNHQKRPAAPDLDCIQHQVRYLGLMENVRVRRAGFAYRQTFDHFLNRYKVVCKATWPNWKGDIKAGILKIIEQYKIPADGYRLGKTKVFIRNPATLFKLEEDREKEIPRMATIIQAHWKGYKARKDWGKWKAAAKIQLMWRKNLFKRYFKLVYETFKDVLFDPKLGKGKPWPKAPRQLQRCSDLLQKMHVTWRAWKIISPLSEEQKSYVRLKIIGYDIFVPTRQKHWDVSRKWEHDYLAKSINVNHPKYVEACKLLFQTYGDTQIIFSDYANKVNPKGKCQKRGIVVTEKNIYKYDPENYKVRKVGTPLVSLNAISLSTKRDLMVVVHVKPPMRDFLLDFSCSVGGGEKVSEFVSLLCMQMKALGQPVPGVTFSDKIKYNNSRTEKKPGQDRVVVFQQETNLLSPMLKRGKTDEDLFTFP